MRVRGCGLHQRTEHRWRFWRISPSRVRRLDEVRKVEGLVLQTVASVASFGTFGASFDRIGEVGLRR